MENTTVFSGRSGIVKASAKLVIKDFAEVMAGFEFELGKTIDIDTPMNITVYPNGNSSKTKGHVGLTLFNTGDASSSPM